MNYFAAIMLCAFGLALAVPSTAQSGRPTIDLSPVLLDARGGEGTTLGLDFEVNGKRGFVKSSEDPTADEIDPEVQYSRFALVYRIAGTFAADEERNPKDFVNARVDANYRLSSAKALGTIDAGGFVTYETDQSFDNEQFVYGISATYGKRNIVRDNDFFGINLRRGQVDPTKDAARQAALGTTSLDKYYRNEAEVLYTIPIQEVIPFIDKLVEGFEFNYRYFHESGAPDAIEAAGIDSFFLRTFRLNLKKDLFIAYSNGKLPFDLQNDEFFTLGFNYKLE